MRTRNHKLLLILSVFAFVALGCGQTRPASTPAFQSPTEAPSPTATTYLVPTAPPLPSAPNVTGPSIYLDGWQDIVITNLCLEYKLKGISPIPKSLNIETILLSGLEATGIRVSTETNNDCDGILTIDATVQPLSASYIPGGTCYSGASVNIRITLTAQDQQANFQIKNEKTPPASIISCARNPEDAPFASLWRRDFVDILGQIWGSPFYHANLQTHALSRFALAGVKRTAPTAETIDLVLSKLSDPIGNPSHYYTALDLISYWHLSGAAPYLHAYIHIPELPYRLVIRTAYCLSSLGELVETDLPPIIALVEASTWADPDLTSVFRGVAPREAAIPPLLAALKDANSSARETIAASLANLGEPAYEYVIPMLEDQHGNVRNAIVDTLSYKDYTVIAPLLSFAAQTEYAPAKQAVTRILEKVSGNELGEDLDAWQGWWQEIEDQMNSLQPADFATTLASDQVILRQYTLEQIIELGPVAADTLPILTEMLSLEKGRTQLLTALALGALGPEGLDVIINHISANTSDLYTYYAALSIMGPDAMDSVPALITNLSKEDIGGTGRVIYPAIVRALNSVTGQNFGSNVEAWQAWWDERN